MSSNESIVFGGQYRVQERETISEVLTVTTIPNDGRLHTSIIRATME